MLALDPAKGQEGVYTFRPVSCCEVSPTPMSSKHTMPTGMLSVPYQAATQGGNFADVVRFLLDVPALDVPTPPTTPPPPPPPPRPPLAAQVEALAHHHDGSGNGGEERTQPVRCVPYSITFFYLERSERKYNIVRDEPNTKVEGRSISSFFLQLLSR